VDPSGQFVRAFDADTPGENIGDALRQLMARSRERESHSGLAGQMGR
jgi:protein SCO1/2